MAKKSKDDDAATIAALQRVAELMQSTSEDLQAFMKSRAVGGAATAGAGAGQVSSWDDPFSEAVPSTNPPLAPTRPVPVVTNTFSAMRVTTADQAPPVANYNPGTPEFRYWVANEALARGIRFWGSLLPAGTTWSTSNPMQVSLVEAGTQLNANYTRRFGLRFYRQKVREIDIFTAESPDVVCHELGHAVLDALRPQLFHVANTETGAFHESFGDISALLCALQVPEMRKAVIEETGGRLNTSSRLSRLAEQLGWGLRQISPRTVERDCLRNAANRFFYRRPDLVPPVADASLLSSEEHSFSRIFTGAFLDALARMFSAGPSKDEASLLSVSQNIAQILIDAVHGASITSAYFSQVAAAMIQADEARFEGRHKAELTGAFLEHGILSVASTLQMGAAPLPEAIHLGALDMTGAGGAAIIYSYEDRKDDDAHRLGFGETPDLPLRPLTIGRDLQLEVHAPEDEGRFAVASATYGAAPYDGAMSQEAASYNFVAGLIQRQQIDLSEATPSLSGAGKKRDGRMTHALVMEGGKSVLKRDGFACGCQWAPRLVCR
ncbi:MULTISPECIES: hypothetical protein [unclassified Bradyrhizobium]|uniref:hypothetical protein n=1 Tax=unclassified Bradyrhizobium TaxID=2631580 RepID=UPI0028E76A19|nr:MULTISPECIES: hypothetical protein [unclassified Bradyrhizobium]